MTLTRIPFQAEMRRAAVDLLDDFSAEYELKLQTYSGRPRTISLPCAFVDKLREAITFNGLQRERVVQVEIVVLHGLFDSAEAAAQKDYFVDTFVDWVSDRYHAAGTNTVIEPRSVEDEPDYVPDWQPPEVQRTYYATVITLEGFAGG